MPFADDNRVVYLKSLPDDLMLSVLTTNDKNIITTPTRQRGQEETLEGDGSIYVLDGTDGV